MPEIVKGNAELFNNFGVGYFAQGNYAEAEAAVKNAIEHDADTAVYRTNLGMSSLCQKKYVAAEIAFKEALERGDSSAEDDLSKTREKLKPLYKQVASFADSGPASMLKEVCVSIRDGGFSSLTPTQVEIIQNYVVVSERTLFGSKTEESQVHEALCSILPQLPHYAGEVAVVEEGGVEEKKGEEGEERDLAPIVAEQREEEMDNTPLLGQWEERMRQEPQGVGVACGSPLV
jgi:tetratricopeptide (TPR) repeat protein